MLLCWQFSVPRTPRKRKKRYRMKYSIDISVTLRVSVLVLVSYFLNNAQLQPVVNKVFTSFTQAKPVLQPMYTFTISTICFGKRWRYSIFYLVVLKSYETTKTKNVLILSVAHSAKPNGSHERLQSLQMAHKYTRGD